MRQTSRMSTGAVITTLADLEPDAVAVRAPDRVLTRRELDRESNWLARAYAEPGVGHDDLVSVTLPDSAEMVLACVAIWKLDATPAPLSPALAPAEVEAVIDAHPAVRSSAVIGLPDDDLGQRVHAVVGHRRRGDRTGRDPELGGRETATHQGAPVDTDRRRAAASRHRQNPLERGSRAGARGRVLSSGSPRSNYWLTFSCRRGSFQFGRTKWQV
ncbi:acyl-CoA synthetase (AMP-forming)/AMP-acid ligase II [Nakamurella sp. UYEF19]|uniref:AMP-binding protein n=1 Tax=Nakamurella sp. UYEF19 TaxID=1756392 RepID=UPI0033999A79